MSCVVAAYTALLAALTIASLLDDLRSKAPVRHAIAEVAALIALVSGIWLWLLGVDLGDLQRLWTIVLVLAVGALIYSTIRGRRRALEEFAAEGLEGRELHQTKRWGDVLTVVVLAPAVLINFVYSLG